VTACATTAAAVAAVRQVSKANPNPIPIKPALSGIAVLPQFCATTSIRTALARAATIFRHAVLIKLECSAGS